MSVIPPSVKIAANRGFIRTTFQAYSTALAGGVTIALLSDVVDQAQAGEWTPLIISAAVTVLSPVLAGLASYLSITANGLPEDYVDAAVDQRFKG